MSSTSFSPQPALAAQTPVVVRKAGSTWLWSLTGVCFLFGILLAMQLRAQQHVRAQREVDSVRPQQMQMEIQNARIKAQREASARAALQGKVNALQKQMASATVGSTTRANQLIAQTKELQLLAGLTPVAGPGILVTLRDNPDAAKQGAETPFLPGIVHDFDVLQVVNELRSAGAEAIAVNGKRITAFSPIRCVGPVIYVNGQPVASPFRIEAIGDAETLESALKMPDGIVDKLSSLFPVRVKATSELKLPAAENLPKMRVSKAG
ncbi:MAG TPA: DUF881 domain-containing protein [Abditibacteriaceae bacterium]|jgi:uncharacterized protein YlxW (UPF0749 family)